MKINQQYKFMKSKLLLIIIYCLICTSISSQVKFKGTSNPSSFLIYNKSLPLSKIPVNFFVKKYVEDSITVWQKKGKTEKSITYRNRIEIKRQSKIDQLTTKAIAFLKIDVIKNTVWKFTSVENYDADNECYLLSIGEDFKTLF